MGPCCPADPADPARPAADSHLPAFGASPPPCCGRLTAAWPTCFNYRLWSWLKWASKRDANGHAVFLGRIDQKVGDDVEIVHKGVAEQAEHCLAGRKIGVVSQLETQGAVAQRVEDEDSFDIQLIVGRPETSAEVVSAEKNDLSRFFEQLGHVQSPTRSRRE